MSNSEELTDLFLRYDIDETLGHVGFASNRHLLAKVTGHEMFQNRMKLKVEKWRPDGFGFHERGRQHIFMPDEEVVDNTCILWQSTQTLPEIGVKAWFLNVEDEQFLSSNLDLGYVFNDKSKWFPKPNAKPTMDVRMLELFAGSFGGWKHAAKIITAKTDCDIQTVAVESSQDLAKSFAISHACNFVDIGNVKNMPVDLFVHSPASWIICTDVRDRDLLEPLARWAPTLVSLSAPCPPWSSAGRQGGLSRPEGMLLIETILHLRWLNIPIMAVEQVAGFENHPDKEVVLRAAHHTGYKLVWSRVVDLLDVTKVARNRWLAVFTKVHSGIPQIPSQVWTKQDRSKMPNPTILLPPEMAAQMFLPEEVVRMARDPAYLKHKGKQLPGTFEFDVLGLRTFSGGTVPCFMARYGSQHLLDDALLRDKGYHSHFVQDLRTNQARFWHPAEIAIMHGFVEPLHIIQDHFLAWLGLGNQIAMPHALLALTNVMVRIAEGFPSIDQLLQFMKEDQVKAAAVELKQVSGGYLVFKTGDLPLHRFLENINLLQECTETDGHTFWSPLHGIQPFDKAHWTLAHMSQLSVMPTQDDEDDNDLNPLFQASITFRDHEQKFWFSGSVPEYDLKANWGHCVEVKFHATDEPYAMTMQYMPSKPDECIHLTRSSVQVLIEGELNILTCTPEPLTSQPHIKALANELFDQYGLLTAKQITSPCTILFDRPLDTAHMSMDFTHLLAASQQIQIHWTWDHCTDNLLAKVQGESTNCHIFSTFWGSVLTEEMQQHLGRSITVTDDHTVMFQPSRAQGVCPVSALRTVIAVLAARTILDHLSETRVDDELMKHVTLKFTRQIWEGLLPEALPISIVQAVMDVAFRIIGGEMPFRLLNGGKMIDLRSHLTDLSSRPDTRTTTIHTVLGLSGGVGSKAQQRTMHQSALAATLIEQGYKLDWVTPTVDLILNKTSLQTLNKVTSMHMGTAKIAAIMQLCKDNGAEPPAMPKPQSHKQHPGAPWNKPKKQKQEILDLGEFSLTSNFFLNEDGTATQQTSQVRAQSTGLCLMTPQQSQPWLKEGNVISGDELGILVIGQLPETSLIHTQVTFPCHNLDGAMVLLHGHLVQLGAKKIACKPGPDKQVTDASCQLMAVTLHRQDFSEQDWTDATHATAAFIKGIVKQDQLDTAIQALWGRSLRNGRSPSTPANSTTIQMHCTVDKDKVIPLLRTSGFNNLFFTPKLQTGRIAPEFQVIWIGADKVKATALSAKVPGCLGLVRGKNDALALRFEQSNHAAAWKQIFPDQDVPKKLDTQRTYKVQGLPFGCSKQMLTEWAENMGWNCTPFRALGPQAWLLRAEEPPKNAEIMMFNSSPLLVTELQPKQTQQHTYVLGPKSNRIVDPWLQSDPWKTGKMAQPPAVATPARALSGPVEAKFAAHDEQLAKLQEEVTKLGKAQERQTQSVQQQFTAAEAREKQNLQHMNETLQQMQRGWEKTFQGAMQSHSSSMDKQFAELRSLFTKRKAQDEAHMESWLGLSTFPCYEKSCRMLQAWQVLLLRFLCHLAVVLGLRSQPTIVQTRHGKVIRMLILICCLFATADAYPVGSHSHECTRVQSAESSGELLLFSVFEATQCHSATNAARIGEAANPGPHAVRIAVTNPTAIVSKEVQYADLATTHGVHIAVAAETSATSRAQTLFAHKIKKSFRRVLWSTPAQEKRERSDGEISLRGQPTGVAVLSSFPMRLAHDTLPTAVQQTSRMIHSIISIGNLQIQLIALYAYTPGGHPKALDMNSALIHDALNASTHLRLPVIIAGDFNGLPFQWEVADRLKTAGFLDLISLHQKLKQSSMPMTCKEATRPDNALLRPRAAALVSNIQVLPDFMFDAHAPVLFDLSINADDYFELRFPMPRTFLDLPIDLDLLDEAYQVAVTQEPNTIEEWGKAVEAAVDTAYRWSQSRAEEPPLFIHALPKTYRGRCQPTPMTRLNTKALLQPGRHGDYQPVSELHTFQAQRMTKQVRRLQSITRGLKKPNPPRAVLQAEWHACLRDTSFEGNFIRWCNAQPEIGAPPWYLPDLDTVHTIYQLAKHHTDAKVHHDNKIWREKTAYLRQLDGQEGHKQAFSMLKQYTPPITELIQDVTQQGIAVSTAHQSEIFVEDGAKFDPTLPVSIDSSQHHITSQTQHSITVQPPVPAQVHDTAVQQQGSHYTPKAIAAALTRFWDPYWNVENPKEIDEAALQEAIQRLPTFDLANISIDDLQQWKAGIRRLKGTSARGVDGISARELKALPDGAIDHLRKILCADDHPFPKWMMLARTHAIPKKAGKIGPQQTRPITVLSQIYRLWGQILTQAIIQKIAPMCPKELTGFMPGRSAMDAAYRQQFLIEQARERDEPYAGCSMDLVKCFNTIRRPVPMAALRQMGVPQHFLIKWETSLDSLTRTWCIGDTVSEPFAVNNGLCEGGPLSVVGMISIGLLWTQSIRQHDIISDVSAYADNWGWASVQEAAHGPITAKTLQITRLTGMTVDWNKSWIWATHAHQLSRLKTAIQSIAGPVAIKQLLHEMDLGCIMTYRGTHRLGKYKTRLAEAKRRLLVLAKMPHDSQTKTHLLQAGIYTQVAYGTELMPVGTQHTDQLRSQACDGVLGHSHSRNSAVAIAAIPKLQDPELYFTFRAIKAAKRFLARASTADRENFLSTAAHHSGTWNSCKGPAGSLKYYLLRMGWTIDREGNIQASAHVQISLLLTGMPTMLKWLQRAWQEELLMRFSHRKEIQGVQPMAMEATRQVVKSFRAKDQPQVLAEISGAFQTAQQQAKWNESDGQCKHCTQPDTRYHRVYECDLLQDLRQQFAPTLQWFQDQAPLAHELPIIHQHEDEDWIRTFFLLPQGNTRYPNSPLQ